MEHEELVKLVKELEMRVAALKEDSRQPAGLTAKKNAGFNPA